MFQVYFFSGKQIHNHLNLSMLFLLVKQNQSIYRYIEITLKKGLMHFTSILFKQDGAGDGNRTRVISLEG